MLSSCATLIKRWYKKLKLMEDSRRASSGATLIVYRGSIVATVNKVATAEERVAKHKSHPALIPGLEQRRPAHTGLEVVAQEVPLRCSHNTAENASSFVYPTLANSATERIR